MVKINIRAAGCQIRPVSRSHCALYKFIYLLAFTCIYLLTCLCSGAYFCINMILITLSTFLAVIVINTHIRGDRKNRVPNWLRRVSSYQLGRYRGGAMTPKKFVWKSVVYFLRFSLSEFVWTSTILITGLWTLWIADLRYSATKLTADMYSG